MRTFRAGLKAWKGFAQRDYLRLVRSITDLCSQGGSDCGKTPWE